MEILRVAVVFLGMFCISEGEYGRVSLLSRELLRRKLCVNITNQMQGVRKFDHATVHRNTE